jgi:polysaccharide biosynthesis protein PslH
MRILFLSRWFPHPPDNGSKIRISNVLMSLSRQHEVSLLAFQENGSIVSTDHLRALQEYCARVQTLPYRGFRPWGPKAFRGVLAAEPRSLVDTFSEKMSAAVQDECSTHQPDIIVASQLDMVPYALRAPGVPAVLEELELSMFIPGERLTGLSPRRLRALATWWKVNTYVRRALPRFAACTVVSEREKANLRHIAPEYANVEVIPNAVDVSRYDGDFGLAHNNQMVFAGALTYQANYDAMRYFLSDIYPMVSRDVSGCLLRITGDHAGVDLTSLPRLGSVEFTGYVADIRPVVAGSWVSVVPLRLGGGTRLKILESMALGTPVVSTTKGAEGLDVIDGENILIADEPQDFAAKVVMLLRSPELRARLAAGGWRLVQAQYDWRTVGTRLCALVERAAA